jgi:hypothetical protein
VPLALSVKVAPDGRVELEKLGTVPSGSVAARPKDKGTPSVVLLAPMVASTGSWFPASITVICTRSVSMRTPSVARKVTL